MRRPCTAAASPARAWPSTLHASSSGYTTRSSGPRRSSNPENDRVPGEAGLLPSADADAPPPAGGAAAAAAAAAAARARSARATAARSRAPIEGWAGAPSAAWTGCEPGGVPAGAPAAGHNAGCAPPARCAAASQPPEGVRARPAPTG